MACEETPPHCCCRCWRPVLRDALGHSGCYSSSSSPRSARRRLSLCRCMILAECAVCVPLLSRTVLVIRCSRSLSRRSRPTATWNFTAGVKTTPQLQAGKAKLIVEATSNDLLRKTGRVERDVTIVTQPPTISVDSEQHYLYLGMADLATFSVSGSYTEAGVRVGDEKFRAWPMPGGKPGLFSLFAFAWNMPTDTRAPRLCGERCGQRRDQPAGGLSPRRSSRITRPMICR